MPDTPNVPPPSAPEMPAAAPATNPPATPAQPAATGASATRSPQPAKAPSKKKPEEPLDPAHVPMTEEFDRAKWTLPPLKIVGIGVAIAAFVAVILIYVNRAKPVASGAITNVAVIQLQDNTVLAAIELNVRNSTPKQWYIDNIKATVNTGQGQFTDNGAAAAVDAQRYFQAFPDLTKAGTNILKFDQKLAPGQQETGTVVFSFPITKDQFDQRKSISVTIQPFDTYPVTFTK